MYRRHRVSEFGEIINKLGAAGFGTLMAAILYGSYKGIWVWGHEFRKLEKERDWLRDMVMRNTVIAQKATEVRAAMSE